MLISFRNRACAVAAVLMFVAPVAQAEVHSVHIVDGGYFPADVYVAAGDSIQFINQSEDAHTVSGPEESWTSGAIGADGTFTLVLEDDTPLEFGGTWSDEENEEEFEIAGSFSYNPPPLEENYELENQEYEGTATTGDTD